MKKYRPEETPAIEDLYQNVPCALISFNMHGKIITTNNTLLKWLEISEEAINELSFSDLMDKGGQFYYQLFVEPMLTMHGEVNEINIALKTPAGTIPCLLNATVTANQYNSTVKIVHAAIFKMDERKKYEAELLNKKVQAEKETQHKTNTLEQVAFEHSHLVRLPLANIMGLISLVDQTLLDDETKRLFTMINNSAGQLDTEIRRIVDKTVS